MLSTKSMPRKKMTRWWRIGLWWLLCVGGIQSMGCAPVEPVPGLRDDVFRGAWLAKNDELSTLSDRAKASLQQMKDMGIRWLALGPRVEMPDIYDPVLTYGSDDEDYLQFIQLAKGMGFSISLMPRIESEAFFKPPFPFRADIRMLTEDKWQEFHNVYEAMLVHYAKLAQKAGVEVLVLGLEYRTYIQKHPDAWRRFAATVRKHFQGKVTYSANWYKEFEEVKFWDSLDFIGIGAYFELTSQPTATLAEIKRGWEPVVKQLRALSASVKRPVVFTEIGYTTFQDAAQYPWKWQNDLDRPLSPTQQADCYRAFFSVMSGESWFKGFFMWRFYTSPALSLPYGYSPIGKPAEDVIAQWLTAPYDPTIAGH